MRFKNSNIRANAPQILWDQVLIMPVAIPIRQ